VLAAERDYRETFLELAFSEGLLDRMPVENLEAGTSRADLGISSLNVIALIANYLETSAPGVTLDPKWVPALDDVEGIAWVLREIDQLSDRAKIGA
jgi:hypothetical protein